MLGPLRRLVPRFIRKSYALKFGIALLIMGLAVGAVGFVATGQITEEVETSVNERLSDQAAQEARNLQSWDERNLVITQTTATELEEQVGSNDRSAVEAVLKERTTELQFERGIRDMHWVSLQNDNVLATSNDPYNGSSLSEIDATWAAGLDGDGTIPEEGTYFGVYEDHEGTTVVAYGYPVKGTSQSQAIVTTVDVSDYGRSIQAQTDGQATMILNSENEVTFANTSRVDSDGFIGSSFGSDESFSGQGTFTTSTPPEAVSTMVGSDFDGEEYAVSYAQVANRDMVVTISSPTNEVYGFVNTVSEWGLYATIGGMAIIVVFGTIIGRNTAASIDRLTTKTEQMEEGTLNVDFETHRIDNIGRLYDGFASMRDALREQIQEARDAREEAELARAEAEQMNRHLERKADEYRGVMQDVSAGDMTQRMNAESESEAMADIATEFNEMIGEIEETVGQLKNFANEVATSSEEVTASSEEVRSASEQVTESIQEISDGADRQNDSLQRVSQEMSGLSTTIEEIASSSNEVADLAERTAETGRDGRDAAQDAIDRMAQLERESEQVTQQIEQLETEMEQIDELIDFISEIAEQTNMLALNANIEAARSGSSGEGFSVVAQEVKELAEETKDAAEDIEQRLEHIQSTTQQTVRGVEGASEQISATTEAVEDTVDALDEIAGYAEDTNTGVQEISAATEEQAASTEEVVAMVDDAATISEETTSEAETVAAAAEEQTTALTEVSKSASDLANQASRLSEALDRFDTDVDAAMEFDDGADLLADVEADPETDEPVAGDDSEAAEAVMELSGEADLDAVEETDGDADGLGTPATFDEETQPTADAGTDSFDDTGSFGVDDALAVDDDVDADGLELDDAMPDEEPSAEAAPETGDADAIADEVVDDATESDAADDADEIQDFDPDIEFGDGEPNDAGIDDAAFDTSAAVPETDEPEIVDETAREPTDEAAADAATEDEPAVQAEPAADETDDESAAERVDDADADADVETAVEGGTVDTEPIVDDGTEEIDEQLDEALGFDEGSFDDLEDEDDDEPETETKEVPGVENIDFGSETTEGTPGEADSTDESDAEDTADEESVDDDDDDESNEDDMFSFAQTEPEDDE